MERGNFFFSLYFVEPRHLGHLNISAPDFFYLHLEKKQMSNFIPTNFLHIDKNFINIIKLKSMELERYV